jgi:DNA processing protein
MERNAGIAVLGSGLKQLSFKSNRAIAQDIVNNGGAVVSEFGFFETSRKHFFPRRNRVISGLSEKTVLIQGGAKSGSLITARLALEQGRDVIAVPGEITSTLSAAPNRLISQGATALNCPEDIVQIMGEQLLIAQSKMAALESDPELLKLLSECPGLSIRQAQESLRLSLSELKTRLTLLELDGVLDVSIDGRIYLRN